VRSHTETAELHDERVGSTVNNYCATIGSVKDYIHARLSQPERALLEDVKRTSGLTESELVRRGLHLVAAEERGRHSALSLAGASVGRFARGPRDLSANRKHLDGFGE
jgi:hypothetical protein